MKMYIVLRDREFITPGLAALVSAHASLACYLKFKDHPNIEAWLNPGPFFKVVCLATDAEFKKLKEVGDNVVLTESRLNDEEVAIAFMPREEYPKMFKFLRMYK